MCGICGCISVNRITEVLLSSMNNTMYKRGPDDAGILQLDVANRQISLAQRRLSILDLSIDGHQPMVSADGNVNIVFNGEIYNYLELKKELTYLGYNFRSNTDTEVIIAAYIYWGVDAIKRFNGMFSIALYDRKINKLFLVRDRIGKKPLYYYWKNNELIFASELKPIMMHPSFHKNIDNQQLEKYLYHHYIAGDNTIFENTYKVLPGQCVEWDNGVLKKTTYWAVNERYKALHTNTIRDYSEAKDQLQNLLIDSVKKRMISDVPLGAFISGGVDSSLITAIAQHSCKEKLKTYTIGFYEKDYNEAIYAKEVADYLGTDHHELYIDEYMMLDLIDDIAEYFDEPMADASQIPTMLVSKLAKKDITVVLSGDGGDELFCGYEQYGKISFMQNHRLLVNTVQNMFRDNKTILNLLPANVENLLRHRHEGYIAQYASDESCVWIERMVKKNRITVLRDMEKDIEYIDDYRMRQMLIDMNNYLPDDILTKVDKASMRYSLETRCPLLDYRIIEYSFSLPMCFKSSQGITKRILRDILYGYVPKKLIDRPKQGFAVPVNKWLCGPLKKELLILSEEIFLEKQGLFDYASIKKMISLADSNYRYRSEIANILWAYFIFQKWYVKYMAE